MTIRNLEFLFKPKSVALIGASNQPSSVGATLAHNLIHGGFTGPIMLVNPKYDSIEGVSVYRDVSSMPATSDLAVICTPPEVIAIRFWGGQPQHAKEAPSSNKRLTPAGGFIGEAFRVFIKLLQGKARFRRVDLVLRSRMLGIWSSCTGLCRPSTRPCNDYREG